MEQIVYKLLGWLWSDYMIYLCLGAGLYFTVGTRLIQVRRIKDMVKLLTETKKTEAGISSFQAFAISLSSRVGTGNIVGVVSAIAIGGPGAVFWTWVLALLGAAHLLLKEPYLKYTRSRSLEAIVVVLHTI